MAPPRTSRNSSLGPRTSRTASLCGRTWTRDTYVARPQAKVTCTPSQRKRETYAKRVNAARSFVRVALARTRHSLVMGQEPLISLHVQYRVPTRSAITDSPISLRTSRGVVSPLLHSFRPSHGAAHLPFHPAVSLLPSEPSPAAGMSEPSLLSAQIRAQQAGRGGEDPRNSQTTPPSGSPLQPEATTPLNRQRPPSHPVLLRKPSLTDHNPIKPLRRASTAPEIFRPSELKTSDFDSQRELAAMCEARQLTSAMEWCLTDRV